MCVCREREREQDREGILLSCLVSLHLSWKVGLYISKLSLWGLIMVCVTPMCHVTCNRCTNIVAYFISLSKCIVICEGRDGEGRGAGGGGGGEGEGWRGREGGGGRRRTRRRKEKEKVNKEEEQKVDGVKTKERERERVLIDIYKAYIPHSMFISVLDYIYPSSLSLSMRLKML